MPNLDRGYENAPTITAEAMAEELLAGRSVNIQQYFTVYDRDDELVWYTNPYGLDGIVCKRPTVATLHRFLNDLECGKDFGMLSE